LIAETIHRLRAWGVKQVSPRLTTNENIREKTHRFDVELIWLLLVMMIFVALILFTLFYDTKTIFEDIFIIGISGCD
jgi:hypothetical protein